MIKYYYTCPIEAAYMAKEFSVKFINPQPIKDNPIIESNTYSNLSILVGDLEYIIKRFGKVVVFDSKQIDIVIKKGIHFFIPEVEND